jgi:cytochrome c oxidase subunit 2
MRLPRLHRPRPVTWLALALALLAAFFAVEPQAAFAQPPSPSILSPESPNAEAISDLFMFVLWFAIGVFILVEGLIIYSVVRFRNKGGDEHVPVQVYGNTKLEIAWTVVPALLAITILVLSLQAMPKIYDIPGDTVAAAAADVGVCYVGNLSVDEVTRAAGTDLLVVKVTGHQWWWEFEYPQYGFRTATQLVAPEGRVVKLEMTASDVIHAWWVPELGPQFNVTPGYVMESWFQVNKQRTFQGQCAMHCGEAHAYMPMEVNVVSQAAFERWLDNERQPRLEPATELAKQGEALFVSKACASCHAISGYPEDKAVARRAPDLTHYGSRSYLSAFLPNTHDNLVHWLRNPEELKPGNKMAVTIRPGFVSEAEAQALAAYLMSLK